MLTGSLVYVGRPAHDPRAQGNQGTTDLSLTTAPATESHSEICSLSVNVRPGILVPFREQCLVTRRDWDFPAPSPPGSRAG
jgi:hypothetical protein